MWVSILALGFVLGMRHALDADHVAAVAAMATRSRSLGDTVRIAGAWGIGHSATLFVAGAALILVGAAVPASVGLVLEGLVGVMLVVLGLGVLRRARRTHVHAHDGSVRAPRALLVGSVHGLAGSAGLALLVIPAMKSSLLAAVYLLVFGVGTTAGMIGFSLLLSVPLAATARRLQRWTRSLEIVLGVANVALGCWIACESAASLLQA